jgi:hypothetical protein
MIIRHTDAEVLQLLVDILWPYKDPEQQWSPDTIAEVAEVLTLLRPELLPWNMDCTVDHSWARNAYDCARQRSYDALTAFVRGEGPHEAIYAEDDTIEALRGLYLKWDGYDDDE